MYHRRSMDFLGSTEQPEKPMGNSRDPSALTPLTRKELAGLRVELERSSEGDVRKTYEDMLAMCKLHGIQPPRPWVIQTLVQAWQVLNRRTAKGR